MCAYRYCYIYIYLSLHVNSTIEVRCVVCVCVRACVGTCSMSPSHVPAISCVSQSEVYRSPGARLRWFAHCLRYLAAHF